ncbi:MAG: hypothetical protein ACOH2F_07635 [Cellulomonas sp.]
MAELIPSDEPESTSTPDDAEEPKSSVRDNWWWTPAFEIVAGVAVVAFQWGSITQSGVWLNWVVAAVGGALAVYGAVQLYRSYPR